MRFYFDAPGGSALPRDLAADYIWIPRALPSYSGSRTTAGGVCTKTTSRLSSAAR